MKLVFYSGGTAEENLPLDHALLNLCQKSKDIVFTFIPSHSYMSDQEFQEVIEHYRPLGVKKFLKLDVDNAHSSVLRKSVLKSDIIHLGGGNTYYFLKYLKKSNLLGELKKWVDNGGVLSGLSAGGIIMTNNIDTAGFPFFDCDDNEENIKNFNAMNLVNFEFFPHYKNSKRYDNDLSLHSTKTPRPVYACPDGTGIVVNGNEISFIGKSACFCQGKKFFLNK